MNKRKNKKYLQIFFISTFIIFFTIFTCYLNFKIEEKINLNEDTSEKLNNNVIIQENDNNLKIHYVDQTTPNMIQTIKTIFARKPLISRGI